MHFEKDSVNSRRNGGAGENHRHVAVAAGAVSLAAGELDAVRGVEERRESVLAHDGEGAHVDDEVVIAEGRAAVGLPDFLGDVFDFACDVNHFLRGEELTFFDVNDAAGLGGGEEEVGLTAEEGWDLDDVADFGDGRALGGVVDVGDEREAELGFDHREEFEAFVESGAARACE